MKASAFLACLLGIFLVVCALGPKNDGSAQSNEPFIMDKDKAITFADWAIQQDLSPSNHDYKFPDYSEANVTHNPDDTWTVQSNFAFKNYADEMEQHQLKITMRYDPIKQQTVSVSQQIL